MPTNAERTRFVFGDRGYYEGFEYHFDTSEVIMCSAIAALLAKGWYVDIEGAPGWGYTVSLTPPECDGKDGYNALTLPAAFVAALDKAMEREKAT